MKNWITQSASAFLAIEAIHILTRCRPQPYEGLQISLDKAQFNGLLISPIRNSSNSTRGLTVELKLAQDFNENAVLT